MTGMLAILGAAESAQAEGSPIHIEWQRFAQKRNVALRCSAIADAAVGSMTIPQTGPVTCAAFRGLPSATV